MFSEAFYEGLTFYDISDPNLKFHITSYTRMTHIPCYYHVIAIIPYPLHTLHHSADTFVIIWIFMAIENCARSSLEMMARFDVLCDWLLNGKKFYRKENVLVNCDAGSCRLRGKHARGYKWSADTERFLFVINFWSICLLSRICISRKSSRQ